MTTEDKRAYTTVALIPDSCHHLHVTAELDSTPVLRISVAATAGDITIHLDRLSTQAISDTVTMLHHAAYELMSWNEERDIE